MTRFINTTDKDEFYLMKQRNERNEKRDRIIDDYLNGKISAKERDKRLRRLQN